MFLFRDLKSTDTGIGKSQGQSISVLLTITCFLAISLYNVTELSILIFSTFKHHRGLYFWSFLSSTWGIAIYAIGFIVKDLQISSQSLFYVTFIIVGWCCMVTGQSVVLYSRLHLIIRNPSTLRLILIMIIVDGIICHIPIIVMVYGANSNSPDPFLVPYSIYEKVQVTIFFIQECIISGVYITQTIKVLRPEGNIRGKATRLVMVHLIWVNVLIVVLDITILALEYSGLYDIQTAYKGLVYSLKLKLEFSILNQLMGLMKKGQSGGYSGSHSHPEDGERGVVHMEILDGTRRDRQSRPDGERVGRSGTGGYSAYVHSGKPGDGERGQNRNKDESVVVLTTEIAVHSNCGPGGGPSEGDSIRESASIDGRSGVTVTDVVGGGNKSDPDNKGSGIKFSTTGF